MKVQYTFTHRVCSVIGWERPVNFQKQRVPRCQRKYTTVYDMCLDFSFVQRFEYLNFL